MTSQWPAAAPTEAGQGIMPKRGTHRQRVRLTVNSRTGSKRKPYHSDVTRGRLALGRIKLAREMHSSVWHRPAGAGARETGDQLDEFRRPRAAHIHREQQSRNCGPSSRGPLENADDD